MRERLQQLIDTNEFEFLKTMSEEDIWKFAFAIFYVFSECEERTGHWINTGSGQECSECHEIQYGYDSNRKYCANCGIKIREDV